MDFQSAMVHSNAVFCNGFFFFTWCLNIWMKLRGETQQEVYRFTDKPCLHRMKFLCQILMLQVNCTDTIWVHFLIIYVSFSSYKHKWHFAISLMLIRIDLIGFLYLLFSLTTLQSFSFFTVSSLNLPYITPHEISAFLYFATFVLLTWQSYSLKHISK